MGVSGISRLKSRVPWFSAIDGIIVLSVCWTVFTFTHPSWRLPVAPRPLPTPIAVNGTATVPGIDWSAASTTVALGFTLACQFCQASGDFYGAVAAHLKGRPDQRLVVISPDPAPEVAEWMRAHGVEVFEHVRENFTRYGFRITPSLALVDDTGQITDVAVGKLSPDEEAQFIARLDGTGQTPLSIRAELLKSGASK